MAATVGQAAMIIEALEGHDQDALQKLGDLAFWTSCKLDTCMEELALWSHAPVGSRIISDAEVREWTMQIREAKAALSAACLCMVMMEDVVDRLRAAIAEHKSSSATPSCSDGSTA